MTRAEQLFIKIKEAEPMMDDSITITADSPKAISQIKKVLVSMNVEFETATKGKSTVFEIDADTDMIQKIRDTKWAAGVSVS